MSRPAPILEWTLAHEQHQPDALFLRFLEGGSLDRARETSFGDLASAMRRVAAAVRDRISRGDRVLLLFPPGPEFAGAYLGTMLAHGIAVPAYTPDPHRLTRTLSRLRAIISDSGSRLVLTTAAIVEQARALLAFAPDLAALDWVAVDDLPEDLGQNASFDLPSADTIAYLQYTSGSTSTPRGVVLTHANVQANVDDHLRLHGRQELLTTVSWLPVHHDMGLGLTLFGPLRQGVASTLLSPLDFIRRPASWLEAISRFQANTTGAPTFGYALAARKTPDDLLTTLDLSRLTTAIVSAEHVHGPTLDAFAARLAPAGLSPAVFSPAYGLAEMTVLATGCPDGLHVRRFDAEGLRAGRVQRDDAGTELVSSGVTSGSELRVVVDGRAVDEHTIGELWLHGPSVGQGYWENPFATEKTFGGQLPDDDRRWLRTGDLGFVDEGHLFVTGRVKDLIIVAGDNLHPHDVETLVEGAHPACRAGNSAAFPWRVGGEERLGVAVEIDVGRGSPIEIVDQIREVVAEGLGASPALIALLSRNTLPKTSSGKRQRRRAAERLLDGSLDVVHRWEPKQDGSLEELLADFALGDEGDFFARGGQSIDLVRLADQLTERFGVDIPLGDLFNDPTCAGVRRALQAADRTVNVYDASVPSPSEARMAALYEVVGRALHVTHVQHLHGPLDPDRLVTALSVVARRHPALRTAWRRTPAGLRIQGDVSSPTLEILTESSVESFQRRFREVADRTFDLATEPSARILLAQTSDDTWLLGWVWPHMVIDALSLDQIDRDLWLAYGGTEFPARARTTPRPQPSHVAFWAQRLAGTAATQLPTHRRVSSPPWPSQQRTIELDPTFVEQLLVLGQAEGCTASITWLAWFLVSVHHWVDEASVRIGTPVVRRRRAADDVGCFVDVLPLVSHLDASTDFRGLLAAVRSVVFDGVAHPAPVQDIQAALKTTGAPAEILFSHVVRLRPRPETGLVHTEQPYDLGITAVPFTLEVFERGDRQVVLTWSTAHFDAPRIDAMVGHLQQHLAAVVRDPSAPVALIHSSPDDGVRSGPTVELPTSPLFGPLFSPDRADRIAVVYDRPYTTRELLDRASGFASTLAAAGHRLGDVVVVDHERSFVQIAAIVAVTMLGGVVLPVTPTTPAGRRAQMLAACNARFTLDADTVASGASFVPREVPQDTAAYVLFTSGSTGVPKGVLLDHRGLVNRIVGGLQILPVQDDDRFVYKTSPTFGDAITEVWIPLWTGNPVVVLADAIVQRPLAFLEALENHGITRFVAVPSYLGVLHRTGLDGRLPTLRVLRSSGEPLTDDLAVALREALPNAAIWNFYGSTETSCDVTAHRVRGGRTLLGSPLANVHLKVVDRFGTPRPRGFPGELWVAGPSVTPGVLSDDGDRFVDQDGKRWFQTRDRVRWTDNGLAGLGRIGRHVKVAGVRVDLDEVTRHLRSLANVADAWAACRDERVVAWVQGARLSSSVVRTLLADHLPAAALPTAVVHVQSLPRLPSGKLDERNLPSTAPVGSHQPSAVPVGRVERSIAAVWAELLNVATVGRHDDFYDLGGQSVVAMEVGARLEREIGIAIPPHVLLRASTVASLAHAIDRGAHSLDELDLQADGPGPPLFLLPGVAGTTARMAKVAAHLCGQRRVIGLEAMSLRADIPPHDRVSSAAATMAQRVQRLQPEGPLLLGGYSFGGLLAFATARELERRGRHIAGVFLFDSRPPAVGPWRSRLRQGLRYQRMRWAVRIRRHRQRGTGTNVAELDRARATKDANFVAWARYRPTPWSGPVTWFRTGDLTEIGSGHWGSVAPNVRVIDIPGDHETCVREPYAAALARAVDRATRDALTLPRRTNRRYPPKT